ncbi:MAG: hypothetical protein ACI9UN_003696, partial [Granulosicoccus sp.]
TNYAKVLDSLLIVTARFENLQINSFLCTDISACYLKV